MWKNAVCGAVLTATHAFGSASAEENETRRANLVADFEFRPTIGVSVGHDSNPDEIADGEGSSFRQLDAGLRSSFGDEEGTQAVVEIEAAIVDYLRSSFDEDYDYDVSLELTHRLDDAVKLEFGAYRSEDGTDDPVTIYSEAWSSVAADLETVELEFEGSVSEYRERVSRSDLEEFDLENFDFVAGAAELRGEFATDNNVAPVFEAQITRIDYTEQRPGKPNRDAVQSSFLVGAEVAVTDDLKVRVGPRRIERVFDEAERDSVVEIGPHIEVEWDPSDRLSLEASYDHALQEPAFEDGLVRVAREADFLVTYEASKRLTLSGGGSIEDEEETGLDYSKTELAAYASARWAVRKNLDVLLQASALRETRRLDDEEETAERAIVRAGLESAF